MTADIRSCRRVAQPSPKHGIFACVVATFLRSVDLSGAKLIRNFFDARILSKWTPYYVATIHHTVLRTL